MAGRFEEDLILDGKAKSTVRNYRHAVAVLAEHYQTPPDRLTEEQVRTYILARRKQLALNSMRPLVGALKFFFSVTVPRDWPTLQAIRLPKKRSLPKVLLPEDCWTIIEAAESLRLQAALRLAFTCGLRVGDIAPLRPEDIDSRQQRLLIRRTKNSNERRVPLPAATLQTLRAWWKQHRNPHLLFPSSAKSPHTNETQKPLSERSLQRGLQALLKAMGWKDRGITFHTLRHSYATTLLDEGVNLRVLQQYLGHQNLQATEIYLHLTQRSDEQARAVVHRVMNGG